MIILFMYASLSIQIYLLKNKFYFIHKRLLIKINLKLTIFI